MDINTIAQEKKSEMNSSEKYPPISSFRDYDFLVTFKGDISQEALITLGGMTRQHAIDRKVFNILIELAQNIQHHSDEKVRPLNSDREVGVGMVAVSEKANRYTIVAGNMILNAQVTPLLEWCQHLNDLNKGELKTLFKEQRRRVLDQTNQTPGLGLIDVARRADHPLDIQVRPVDEKRSFLVFTVAVDKEKGR